MNKRQSHLKELSKAEKTLQEGRNPFLFLRTDTKKASLSSRIKRGLNFAIAFFVIESAQKTIESSPGDSRKVSLLREPKLKPSLSISVAEAQREPRLHSGRVPEEPAILSGVISLR